MVVWEGGEGGKWDVVNDGGWLWHGAFLISPIAEHQLGPPHARHILS